MSRRGAGKLETPLSNEARTPMVITISVRLRSSRKRGLCALSWHLGTLVQCDNDLSCGHAPTKIIACAGLSDLDREEKVAIGALDIGSRLSVGRPAKCNTSGKYAGRVFLCLRAINRPGWRGGHGGVSWLGYQTGDLLIRHGAQFLATFARGRGMIAMPLVAPGARCA